MEKLKLVESAESIRTVSAEAVREYIEKMDTLAVKMNEAMLAREDIFELVGGEKNITMMKDNHYNHLRFIGSIMQTPDAETLVDTVLWVFRAYMSRGFHTNYWAAQINTWTRILKENLSAESYIEVASVYNWLSINIPFFTIAADEKLEKSRHMEG